MVTRRHVDVRHGALHQPILKLGNGQFALLFVILAMLLALVALVLRLGRSAAF